MSIQVKVPALLQKLVGDSRSVPAEGETVGEVLDNMESQYPGFKARLIDEKGEIHQFINLYLNDEDIRFLNGINAPVKDGDTITILPAVAGGCSRS